MRWMGKLSFLFPFLCDACEMRRRFIGAIGNFTSAIFNCFFFKKKKKNMVYSIIIYLFF